MPDLTPEQIAENATKPQTANVGGRSAAQVPIQDQIAADKYAKANQAVSGTNANGGPVSGWGGLRIAKANPPGAV